MIFLILGAILALVAGYIFYGRFLAKSYGLDDRSPTPAVAMHDGMDYFPARRIILFGHHFSSIAGAGPIVGPIMAAVAFGWLPALLWILLAVIFIGAMHDFSALVASIRHRARSIGEIIKEYISPWGQKLFLIFLWLALVYVIIVFLDLTSKTFLANGGVATSSALYILLAILFGITLYRLKISIFLLSVIFLPLVFFIIWLGQKIPLGRELIPALLYEDPTTTYKLALLLYCFFASIIPVWLLLQPRDYLSSFILYGCVLGGGLGLLVGALQGRLLIKYDYFTSYFHPELGGMFPILFITIACGAVSGFHCVVASGTTAKQLARESDAKVIGYGGMLMEGVVALIALSSVVIFSSSESLLKENPVRIFAGGLGRFLHAFSIPQKFGETFGLLAISVFILTTLDTCTRIGRFLLEELFGLGKGISARMLSTLATLTIPAMLLMMRFKDPQGKIIPIWKMIWPVFGSTNQLIAGLALLAIACWLRSLGRNAFFVIIPMIIMIGVTSWSLGLLVLNPAQTILVRLTAGGLLILAIFLVIEALRTGLWRRRRS
jgi:carbon starvation protein